jgi:tetratricopeptide (TPR) repeat protein
VKQIGRNLNVRYVLEGSVQRGGNRMRVNVQLIDAETGSHLWGERFDKLVADLFDMQDEIVSRLANRLGQELADAEAKRAERVANPDSMDHYFLGLALFNKGGAESLHLARSRFSRALDLDPDNVDALVGRARVDLTLGTACMPDTRAERLGFAEIDLQKALKLRSESAAAHVALGFLRVCSNRALQGIAECERALSIDRNHAAAHVWIGMAKYVVGRSEETEAHVLEALRISPRDTDAGVWMMIAAYAKLYTGLDEEGVVWANRSIEVYRDNPTIYFTLAAALARLGRAEEAREAVRTGLEINPSFTITRYRSLELSGNPLYLAGRNRMYEGMRLAGVPEG